MPSLAEAPSRASFNRRMLAVPLLLSLLLNAAVLALLDYAPAPPPEEEMAVPVELVPAPPPPPAAPPPPKAEVKPEPPKPEVKPEVKSEPPNPEVKSEPPKPEMKPEPPKPEPPPPPKAERPKPPPKVEPPARKPLPLHLAPVPKVEHNSEDGVPAATDPAKPDRPRLSAAQRNLRDLLMSQVVAIWSPPNAWRGRNAHFSLAVDLLPNGMLGPPYAGDRPLDMRNAITGWEGLPPDQRELVGGLARALYLAQPFHLPDAAAAQAPVTVELDFRVDDIP